MIDDNRYEFLNWLKEGGRRKWGEHESVQKFKEESDHYGDPYSAYLDAWSLPDSLTTEFMDSHSFSGSGDTGSSFSEATIVKNQWLIHFTDSAADIASEGFKYGTSDIDQLGLTHHQDKSTKRGSYAFAYKSSNFERYYKGRHGFRYGDEAVLFRASGVSAYHYGDQEEQVIFSTRTASDIIPIYNAGGEFYVGNAELGKNGREADHDNMFENVPQAVDWVIKNFRQYKRLLL